MLDTIREFGRDWLAELGEVRSVADRHAHWYAALSQAADEGWMGPGQVDWYRRMTAEHAQLRTALEHLLAADPAAALEMAGALWFFWFACGHVHEGRRFLERALDEAPPGGAARAQGLWALGLTMLLQGDMDPALETGLRCARAAAPLGDPEPELRAAYLRAVSVLMPGDPTTAIALAGPRARAGHGGRTSGTGWLLCRLATGYALCDLGRYEEASEEARGCGSPVRSWESAGCGRTRTTSWPSRRWGSASTGRRPATCGRCFRGSGCWATASASRWAWTCSRPRWRPWATGSWPRGCSAPGTPGGARSAGRRWARPR